ncbi:MAG: transglutaminase-like domain-containing protein [Candidatus Dojkabacteria bacterium]|nr:MAG: transglutaminase-like domain-containing protein [Candidatus Dojkabacteria bacterium]
MWVRNTFFTRFLSISIFFVALFVSIPSTLAADFTKTVTKDIAINSAEQVSVSEVHSITWNGTATYFPASKNTNIFTIYPPLVSPGLDIEKMVTNIRVVDEFGKPLTIQTKKNGDALEISVPYYEDLTAGNKVSFTLRYDTTLLTKKDGGIIEIMHNAISKDFQERRKSASGTYDEVFKMEYNFLINKSLGTPDMVLPTSGRVRDSSTTTTVTFTANDLIQQPVRITVGSKRYVKFTLQTTIDKTNGDVHPLFKSLVNNQIELALPTDFPGVGQKVYFSNISPRPTKLETDENGNLIAQIPVNAADGGEIIIEGYAEISRVSFSKEDARKWKFSDIPDDMKQYTAGALPEWPVDDPEIGTIVQKLKDSNGSVLTTVENALNFVTDTLEYKDFSSASELRRLGAKGALAAKQGVCMEYSDLLLTLLRRLGIPSRNVYGDGVGSFVDQSISGIGHQWIEVWFPEQGWVSIDPTWSENSYKIIGPDLDHFSWYKTSESPNKPSGFSCVTWDNGSPCNQAVTIETVSVDELPERETVESVHDLKAAIDANAREEIFPGAGKIAETLGNSYLGRLLLNNLSLNIMLAIAIYIVLYLLVRNIAKIMKRNREKRSSMPLSVNNSSQAQPVQPEQNPPLPPLPPTFPA